MRLVLSSIMALALGCGGPQTRDGALDEGQAMAPPSMECLPEPDVERRDLTQRMRIGWDLATESFLVPPPEPPADRTGASLRAWSSEVLAAWIQRKSHTIEMARRELDVAAEEAHRQRIMGGAIVGLMYEDMARSLTAIPPPEELQDEPAIQEVFEDTLRGEAMPFLEHARRAYSACAQNAVEPASMRHWSRFCRERGEHLPAPERVEVGEEGTTVEVIAD